MRQNDKRYSPNKKITGNNQLPRATWACVTRMIEGSETTIFQEKFSNWGSPSIATAPMETRRRSVAIEAFDILKMFATHRPEDRIFDDGTGEIVEIYRIKEFEKELVSRGRELWYFCLTFFYRMLWRILVGRIIYYTV